MATTNKNITDFAHTVYAANSTQVTIGNSTVSSIISQSGVTIANSTVNTSITVGTAAFNTNSSYTALTTVANGNIGVGKTTPAFNLDVNGSINFTGTMYSNSVALNNGLKGGGTDGVFYENDITVTTSYTISANKNAMTAGPITINTGATVTVNTGTTWVIV
jgi:hypothetical protein